MPTPISPSRPRRSTAHRLLCSAPDRTAAMELLAFNSAQHRFTGLWSLELDSSPVMPLAAGRDSRFHAEDWGRSGEVRLPDVGSSKEQRDWGVQSCVSNYESRSCSVTASGPNRRPAARRSSASASRPTGYGFHLRRTHRKCRAWHLGAGASRLASPGVTRAIREFKNGETPCT